ncbi:MAG TPA: MBL fold metallo-hydrolase [Pseudonocardiaceae bacterium]
MLNQVADGVWVRQSEWVSSNTIAVRGEGGLILVDPGIDGAELNQLADDLGRLGMPVIAGFSTHPHWDHLLWHSRFGDVPRYGTPACVQAAQAGRERGQQMAAESASGIPLELLGLLTPLPEGGGPVPGEIIEHSAHAVGHAAVLLADRASCSSATCSPTSWFRCPIGAAPIRWATTRRHSVCWARPPGTSTSWSPATAQLPTGPRWRPGSRPTTAISTRCCGEKNRSTRGGDRAGRHSQDHRDNAARWSRVCQVCENSESSPASWPP